MSPRIGNSPSPLPRVDVAWWFRNAGTPPRPASRCSMPAAMPSMRRSPPRWRCGAVEPWNSGLGGVGHAVVHRAGQARAEIIDFGPTAPAALEAKRFTLTGRIAADLFAWPEVEGDANIHGPLSFVIPSAVGRASGNARPLGALAARRNRGSSVALARRGLPQDWYTTLKVASFARQCCATIPKVRASTCAMGCRRSRPIRGH